MFPAAERAHRSSVSPRSSHTEAAVAGGALPVRDAAWVDTHPVTTHPRRPEVGITEAPTLQRRWYSRIMSTTFELRVGDRGRVVLPAALRERLGLRQGDVLSVTLEGGQLVASTPHAALERVRARVRGTGVVEELLDDRRRQTEAEQ